MNLHMTINGKQRAWMAGCLAIGLGLGLTLVEPAQAQTHFRRNRGLRTPNFATSRYVKGLDIHTRAKPEGEVRIQPFPDPGLGGPGKTPRRPWTPGFPPTCPPTCPPNTPPITNPCPGGPNTILPIADELLFQIQTFLNDFGPMRCRVPQGEFIYRDAQRLYATALLLRQAVANGAPTCDLKRLQARLDQDCRRFVNRVNCVAQGRTGPNIERARYIGYLCDRIVHTY